MFSSVLWNVHVHANVCACVGCCTSPGVSWTVSNGFPCDSECNNTCKHGERRERGRKRCHKCPLLLNSCNAVHKKLTKLMTFFFNLYFILNCIKSSNRGGGGEIWGRGVQPQICWASNYHDSREETGEISVTIPFISCSKFNTIAPLLLFPRPSLITLFPPVSSPAFLPWQEEESFLSLAVPF